ncbi:MAG: ATP-binding protein [Candidatus Synoicihabitans palmerolidicus]|nr:ATP-binding protein [Candidatus Synoicihabitans palmerolidicus]
MIRLNLSRYCANNSEANLPLISHRIAGDTVDRIDTYQAWLECSLRLGLPEISDQKLGDITICAREGLINALQHGCQGRCRSIRRPTSGLSANEQDIHVRITDSGTGHEFDLDHHEPAAAANLLGEHRGLVMLKHIPTRTTAFNGGSHLEMDFAI